MINYDLSKIILIIKICVPITNRRRRLIKKVSKKTSQMNTSDFTTTLLVDENPEAVFNAINNVRGWWQGAIEGNSSELNDEFSYRMKEFHFSKQKVVELIAGEKVVWLVTDSKLSFTKDQSEWTGTKIIFEITEHENKTQLRFTHVGLVPKFECYGACSNGWQQLIQQSLFSLVTTGKGKAVF
jgi:hypothetical protein